MTLTTPDVPEAATPARSGVLHVAVDPDGSVAGMGGIPLPPGLESIDVYDLFARDLGAVAGLSISGTCDQRFLARHRDELTAFVEGGGRVLVNGHVVEPFIAGLAPWRKLAYRGPRDLAITSLAPHPVWEGVDLDDVLFRTGVPGDHTREELARIGVAGFYARGYQLDLPEGAVAVNGIGPLRAPVDYAYPLGRGEVVVHAGLDLFAMIDPRRSTRVLGSNVVRWLNGESR